MMPVYEAGYAYPTSEFAQQCGAGSTGCHIVTRVLSKTGNKRLVTPVLATKTPFKTEDDAAKWIADHTAGEVSNASA